MKRKAPYKVILIGDGATGKTTLRMNFMGESVSEGQYLMTIGADFSVKKISMDSDDYTLQIWDLAGQKQFGGILDGYFKGTKGILLVFSLDRPESFQNLDKWIDEFLQDGKQEIQPIILLGNKCDLPNRAVKKQDAEEYVMNLKKRFDEPTFSAKYFETSAIRGDNVSEAFEEILSIMIENREHFM